MSKSETLEKLYSIAPQLLEKGELKLSHLSMKPLRKLPRKLRSTYTIDNQECLIFYFPHMPGWYAWIKFRMNTTVAGKIWKDYPMYALIELQDHSRLSMMVHRKHTLDRYNERRGLGSQSVDDILEEMSYSDCKRIYNFKEVNNDQRLLIGNSNNGAFLGFIDRIIGYREVYTFISSQMIKEGQEPDPSDELMEAIAEYEKRFGREGSIDIINVLTKQVN